MTSSTRRIMISAGEVSGDEHASEVIKKLQLHGNFEFYGMGGQKMRATGMDTVIDSQDMAIIGIINTIIHFPKIKRAFNSMKNLLYKKRPDLLIIVDYPEFNLRLANIAHKLGIKVLIYIAPQVWAWRKGRVKKIVKIADRIATILPFEAKYYEKYRIPVNYVGHPLSEKIGKNIAQNSLDDKNLAEYKVLVLPGSRYSEIKFLMPVLNQSMRIMTQSSSKKISFHILKADGIEKNDLLKYLDESSYDFNISDSSQYSDQEKFSQMASFDIAIGASGTAVLQLALCRTPTIVIYKLSTLNYQVVKRLINIPFVSLPNILCEKEIFPELIQHNATPKNIAAKALDLLADRSKRHKMRIELKDVIERLNVPQGNASSNVAKIINEMIE